MVVWTRNKENIAEAKKQFWHELHTLVIKRYDVQPVIAADKLTALYNQAVMGGEISKEEYKDNLSWRVELKELDKNINEYRCTSGYFSEYNSSDISEISKI